MQRGDLCYRKGKGLWSRGLPKDSERQDVARRQPPQLSCNDTSTVAAAQDIGSHHAHTRTGTGLRDVHTGGGVATGALFVGVKKQ